MEVGRMKMSDTAQAAQYTHRSDTGTRYWRPPQSKQGDGHKQSAPQGFASVHMVSALNSR